MGCQTGCGRIGCGHRAFGGLAHEVGHTSIGFESGQQLHAFVQVIIHLTLVIATLALALGEDHIRHGLGVQIDKFLGIVFRHFLNAELASGLRQALIDDAIHLLAVIARFLAFSWLETFAALTFGMGVKLAEQTFGLRFPRHTTVLRNLPCGLLVHHGALQTSKGRVHLGDHIAAFDQIERNILNIMLGELRSLTFVQHVRTLKKSVHLFGIVPPLALRSTSDPRCVPLGFRFLRHWLSTSYCTTQRPYST